MANGEHVMAENRRVSRLRFPYYDLDTALNIVRRVFEERGGRVSEDGLAEMLGTSKRKTAFQVKVTAAELFGLLRREMDGLHVTDLALRIVRPRSPGDRAQAMAEAFLSVPLFDVVQKQYAGSPLPRDEGFRNALEIDFGVTPKRVADLFATLIRSAHQANVLQESGGNTYLSRGPGIAEPGPPESPSETAEEQKASRPDMVPSGSPHPAVSGLLQVLPTSNAPWSTEERDRWLEAFSATIKVLYPVEDDK